jgi:hypothetical protein
MKEITRRLYTKPVILGMAFFVGLALVVGLFVTTTKSTAAPNGFPVAAGNDEFETADDGETFHDFEGKKIPAGFFGAGSLAYGELVALKGVPLAPGSDVDTIIYRHNTVFGPGGSTALTMTGLSLVSSAPLTIHFNNGVQTWTEQWNMAVGLSAYKASTGSMTINSSTFDSTLKVWPKFTFTKVGGGGGPIVLDTGAPTGPGLTAADSATTIGIGTIEPSPRPAPEPTVAPAPCAVIDDSEPVTKIGADSAFATAATTSSCPPITLSAIGQPWPIIVPITEEERWARHRPGPRGFIKQQQGGVAE